MAAPSSPCPEQKQTCVVTVTYGRRLDLLQQVVAAALRCGAGQVVVVDNGTPPDIKQGIVRLQEQHGQDRLHIVTLLSNTGSAGGFNAGIKKASSLEGVRFIWLLDDDNLPRDDALAQLVKAWYALGQDECNTLLSFRHEKSVYRKHLKHGTPMAVYPGSFFNFDLRNLVPFSDKREFNRTPPVQKAGCRQIGMAAYGGFWFASSWIKKVGLPDTRFFLYFDDYDFSMRIPASGGHIWLCPQSLVSDIEPSWRSAKAHTHPWMTPHENIARIYFSIRNRIYIETRQHPNDGVYRLNKYLYLLLRVFLNSRRGAVHNLRRIRSSKIRWQIICQAIQDGERGSLGADYPAFLAASAPCLLRKHNQPQV